MYRSLMYGLLGCALVSASTAEAAPKHSASHATTPASLWKVNVTRDAMTDKKSCFATYLPDQRVQVAPDEGVAVSMQGYGGIKFWRMRVNDDAPQDEGYWPNFSSSSNMMSVVDLTPGIADGSITHVRIEILTVLDNLAEIDVDLHEGVAVMRALRTACA